MAYLDSMDARTGFLARDSVSDKGKELTGAYNAGDPFPHVMIDDFLPPELAEAMLARFGADSDAELNRGFDRAQERYKTSYHPDAMEDFSRQVFYAFNSRPFIKVLENITGIKGLIPDPYYSGAGYHEIRPGGHLSVHADFNHHKLLNLERRINVLIYLNKDWREEYGGQLELWDSGMTRQAHSILPSFNRCVIFNTTSESMHGNPQMVACPDGRTRKSIALYYYTATWDGSKRSHTTQFKVRANSEDARDWAVRLLELRNDLLPPLLVRGLVRIGHILKRTRP